MARNEIPRKRMRWVSGLLLILAGCIDSPATAPTAAAPILSGQARVWFYRPWEPSESLDLALIDMNGSYVGAVANGSAFYRDVPPGHYHIARCFLRLANPAGDRASRNRSRPHRHLRGHRFQFPRVKPSPSLAL